MPSKEEAKRGIKELVKKYEQKSPSELKSMNEETVKKNFILPLFRYLGWDVDSDDVSAEEKISKKRVDYGFKINGMTKFFLEAKKPSEDVITDVDHIRQAINYSYWQSVTWAILTNFQDLIVFNAEWKGRNLSENRFITLNYKEFVDKFDDLWLLSQESFEKNLIDEKAVSLGKKQKREQVSNKILNDMIEWRTQLTKNINKYDHKLDEETLDEAVQRILDRLIFIKSCEDRLIEQKILLSKAHQWEENWQNAKRGLWDELKIVFREFDQKYNSRLFESHICESLKIDDGIFFKIINELNGDDAGLVKYDFSAIPVDVLGNIYEQYLGHILKKSKKTTKVIEKHAHRKEQGIYYTPTYIVDYIVKNTIVEYARDKTLDEILDMKILDPACGSGSFLIKAYSTLLELIEKRLQSKEISKHWHTFKNYSDRLILAQKIAILTQCIHGVDLDKKAVEITQLNLLLKLLEGETKETLSNVKEIKKLLPMLNDNIKCGNSLIDDPKIAGDKAFNWRKEFPEIMKNGGFDIVIGNPPYVRVQNLKHEEIDWYKKYKKTAYKRVDISILFIELAKQILRENGLVGYVTSNQFLVTEYGRKMRQFILDNYRPMQIIDFGGLPIFEDAITYVSIFIFKNDEKNNFMYLKIKDLKQAIKPDLKKSIEININKLSDEPWVLTSQIDLKLIDKLNSLPKLNKIGNAWAGIITGLDEVLMFNEEQVKKEKFEKDAILPIIRGTDPKRYIYSKPSRYVIYPYKEINGKTTIFDETELKNKYPICYSYLLKNKTKLLKRKDSRKLFGGKKWFGLIRFGRKDIFNKIKIVTPGEVKTHKFSLDISKSGFSCARVFAITIDNPEYDIKYVLGLLNSKVARFYLQCLAPLKQGGFYTYSSTILKQIPIKLIQKSEQKIIIEKVEKILNLNKKLDEIGNKKTDERARIEEEKKKTDAEIDELVYKLYDITDAEKKIIEESLK